MYIGYNRWFLDSNKVELEGLYFTENINEYTAHLGTTAYEWSEISKLIATNRDYQIGGSGSVVEFDSLINFLDDYILDLNLSQLEIFFLDKKRFVSTKISLSWRNKTSPDEMKFSPIKNILDGFLETML